MNRPIPRLSCLFFCVMAVVQAQPARLVWIPWRNASATIKQNLKKITAYRTVSLYDDIVQGIQAGEGCAVEIAPIELDVDGQRKRGFAIAKTGSFCCGSHGCSVDYYAADNRHYLSMILQNRDATQLVKNGIVTETGRFIPYERRK